MSSITTHYIIDMSSNNNFVQVAAVEGDGYDQRYMEIELIENGTQYIPDDSEYYITIMGTNANGTEVWNTGTVTSSGYLLFELTYTMMCAPGRGIYQVALMSTTENTQLKSFPFYVIVTKAALSASEITESNEFQVLADFIEEVGSLEEYVETAEGYMESAEASATAAATSASNASTYATNAKTYMNNAKTYASNASTSETNAASSATAAATSATNAETSETNAAASESAAATSETNAATSESNASDSATLAESYAVGGTGTRTGEDTDNAEYYKDQCETIAAGLSGALLPMGSIYFAALDLTTSQAGYMYKIIDSFTTTSDFEEGSGYTIPAGATVYETTNTTWAILCYPGTEFVVASTEPTQSAGDYWILDYT